MQKELLPVEAGADPENARKGQGFSAMKGCCTLFLVVFTLGSELKISPDSTVVIGLETRENEHARKLDFVQVNLNMAECMHASRFLLATQSDLLRRSSVYLKKSVKYIGLGKRILGELLPYSVRLIDQWCILSYLGVLR